MSRLEKFLSESAAAGKITLHEAAGIYAACKLVTRWTMIDRDDFESPSGAGAGTKATEALETMVDSVIAGTN